METVAVRSEPSLQVSQTEVLDTRDSEESPPVLRLRLTKPKNDRKVGWREGTVDNEHMGKKKSKCCCIYKKPVAFGESSSEDDEECEHCFGHPEKRRKNMKTKGEHDHDHSPDVEGHTVDEGSNDTDGPTCSWTKKGTSTSPTDEAEASSSPVTEPTAIETESTPPPAPMETEPALPPPLSDDAAAPTPSPDLSLTQP